MKFTFDRQFYIPKGSIEIKDPSSTAIAYLVAPGETRAKWSAAAFSGKRAKYDWFYSFKDEQSARERIARHAEGVRQTEAMRQERRAQIKREKCNDIGDVWGKVTTQFAKGGSASLSCAETAVCLRASLARHFPGVKFSVRSHEYSGGNSIDVRWIDGPSTKIVDRIARNYSFRGFDGMVDCSYQKRRWLSKDGEMSLAESPRDAQGYSDPIIGDPHSPECVLIEYGAGYVSTQRERTLESYLPEVRQAAQEYGLEMPAEFADLSALHRWLNGARVQWSHGSDYLSDLMWREECRRAENA